VIERVIHVVLLLVMPPLLLGVINKTKAWFAGRNGPPLLQPYFDIAKLMRKGMVLSTTTTWIFRAAPAIGLAAVVLAGLLVPIGRFAAPIAFTGDMILFAYLFGLARFFTASAALDTGSSFEGMGAAREVTFASLTEPALFFALLVLARISGSLTLTDMLHGPATGFAAAAAPLTLVGLGLFVVLLAETCRIPVDDPNTHLELTMIHEVMVLDHSGPPFAAILHGAALKLCIFAVLLAEAVLPIGELPPLLAAGALAVAVLAVAVGVGLVESLLARFAFRRVPLLLTTAFLLCLFALLVAWKGIGA
jgi:formate hydrogenlyase subunit 4